MPLLRAPSGRPPASRGGTAPSSLEEYARRTERANKSALSWLESHGLRAAKQPLDALNRFFSAIDAFTGVPVRTTLYNYPALTYLVPQTNIPTFLMHREAGWRFTPAKKKSVMEEMGKALRGERRVEFGDILRERLAVDKDRYGPLAPWLVAGVGFLGDIFSDPLTYVSIGTKALAKEGAEAAAAELAEKGLTRGRLEELAERGLPVTEKLLERAASEPISGAAISELGPEFNRALMAALRSEASEKLGAKQGVKLLGQEVIPHSQEMLERGAAAAKRAYAALAKRPAAGAPIRYFERAFLPPYAPLKRAGREVEAAAVKMAIRRGAGAEAATEAALRQGLGVMLRNYTDDELLHLGAALDFAAKPWRAELKAAKEEAFKASRLMRSAHDEAVRAAALTRYAKAKARQSELIEALLGDLAPRLRAYARSKGIDEGRLTSLAKHFEALMDDVIQRETAVGIREARLVPGTSAAYFPYVPRGERTIRQHITSGLRRAVGAPTPEDKLLMALAQAAKKQKGRTGKWLETARLGASAARRFEPGAPPVYALTSIVGPKKREALSLLEYGRTQVPELHAVRAAVKRGQKAAKDIGLAELSDSLFGVMGREIGPDEARSIARAAKAGSQALKPGLTVIRVPGGRLAGKTVIVPERIVRIYEGLNAIYSSDEAMRSLQRSWRTVQNLWRRIATTYNPGFHGRNAASNLLLLATDDLAAPEGIVKGLRMVRAIQKGTADPRTRAAYEEMTRLGVARGTFVKAEQLGTELTGGLRREAYRARDPRMVMEHLGELVEDGMRIGGYLNARAKGLSKEAAALAVDDALFDYSKRSLTLTEQKIRELIPFLVWKRRVLPKMARTLLTDPKHVLWLPHAREAGRAATDIDERNMPRYMREMMAIPLPAKTAKGHPLYLNPNVPVQDLAFLADVRRGLWEMLTPLIKAPLEVTVFNRSVYFDEPIDEGLLVRAPLGETIEKRFKNAKLYRELKLRLGLDTYVDRQTGQPYLAVSPKAMYVLRTLPFFNNIAKAIDTRERSPYDALAALTGIKLIPGDPERWNIDKIFEDSELIRIALKRLRAKGITRQGGRGKPRARSTYYRKVRPL